MKNGYTVSMKNKALEALQILLGSTIFAIAVAWIASEVGLVTGGVSGIGIVIKELSGGFVPIFLTSLIMNIPLFVICTLQRGIKFIGKSAFAFSALTLALSIFEAVPSPLDLEGDLILACISYGILSGLGLGLILRSGATSGGTDMLAAIIKYKSPSLSISALIVAIDIVIVGMGVFVFGARISLYAIIALVISAKAIDLVLSGLEASKSVFIISDKAEEISKRISVELTRGVTGIDAEGMYTGSKRKMLMSVISARELPKLRQIVSECDGNAFVTVGNATQVLGEGFGELFDSTSLR